MKDIAKHKAEQKEKSSSRVTGRRSVYGQMAQTQNYYLNINFSLFLQTDIEHLSQQLMARLANPPSESATIFIDDPSSRNNCLGPRQIEVRCVYLEDLIGKILWYCGC